MAQKEIVVTINPDGSTKVAVKGCPGPDCKAFSQPIEEALGDVTEDKPTREMHERGNTYDRVQNRR